MILTKISGLRDPEDIELIGAMGPTYMTFDFTPLSDRYMGEVDASIFSKIPSRVRRVGRFADEHTIRIIALCGRYGFTAVELDGNENAAQCEQLSAEGIEVLKTIRPKDINNLEKYEGVCNRVIFKGVDMSIVEGYKGRTPFILCTEELVSVENQMFSGVDSGEGMECRVGCKDRVVVCDYLKFYKSR